MEKGRGFLWVALLGEKGCGGGNFWECFWGFEFYR